MKKNKRKIIIITSALLTAIIIGVIVSVFCRTDNNKTDTDIVALNDETEQETQSPKTEKEPETEAETEPETEAETEPEDSFTEPEIETSVVAERDYQNVDWVAVLEQVIGAGNAEEINWDEKSWFSVGVVTEDVPDNNGGITQNKPTLEQLLEIDKGTYDKIFYTDENGVTYSNCQSIDSEVMKAKNAWIKDNFGTAFKYNGIEFGWDSANEAYYWVYKYGKIHYMTSTSTSMEGQYYRNFYAYRIADYLGFYGKDFALYNNQDALMQDEFFVGMQDTKMTVDDPVGNNISYLKQLGWVEAEEQDDVEKYWSYESPEGVPAYIRSDGTIAVYIKFPEDDKDKVYSFTIEEYNE
ncbi:MAG: hypothetical protein ACI4EN_05705 [Butyrivibrio sp.]